MGVSVETYTVHSVENGWLNAQSETSVLTTSQDSGNTMEEGGERTEELEDDEACYEMLAPGHGIAVSYMSSQHLQAAAQDFTQGFKLINTSSTECEKGPRPFPILQLLTMNSFCWRDNHRSFKRNHGQVTHGQVHSQTWSMGIANGTWRKKGDILGVGRECRGRL